MPLLDKNSTDSDAKPKTPAKATPTKTPRRNKKLPNTKENNQTLLTGFFKTKVASTPSKTNEAIADNEVNTPSKPSTMKEDRSSFVVMELVVGVPVISVQTPAPVPLVISTK